MNRPPQRSAKNQIPSSGTATRGRARPPGAPFVFTVQADSHLDLGVDTGAYRKSILHAVAGGTDFHVDLGDTFMTDKYLRPEDARPHYLAQRYYLGLVGRVAPVFLVLGNHVVLEGLHEIDRGGDVGTPGLHLVVVEPAGGRHGVIVADCDQ